MAVTMERPGESGNTEGDRPTTLYGLAKDAYEATGGDWDRAEDILFEQIERNDPPFVALRRQLLRPVIRAQLKSVSTDIRRSLWNPSGSSKTYERPVPEPLIEDTPPADADEESRPVILPAPERPVVMGRGRLQRLLEVTPQPPVPALPEVSAPRTEWQSNPDLAAAMRGYAQRTMLDYPVGRLGPLGNLTIQQVRDAVLIFRRQRRDSTYHEALFGLIAKDQPGYRKVRELYTADQLDRIREQATAIARLALAPR